MSSRPHVHVTLREHEDTLPSPWATVAEVSVDLRAFYPPTERGIQHAIDLMSRAYLRALSQLQERQS